MMRSLFSGVSGLRIHQTRMDVIGNNIANVNTTGFKSSRVTFVDAMLQRLAGASADNAQTGRAGVNPQQIGLGANLGSIQNIMTQGVAQRTDRPLDATIQGNGFFIVGDASGTYFTRAGNIDWNGHRFSIGGMQLMGWPAIEDHNRPGNFMIEQGSVRPLETPPEVRFMDPVATSLVEVLGNLNINDRRISDETDPNHNSLVRPVQFYDTIGNRWTADVRFTWRPPENDETAFDDEPHSTNAHSLWTFEFVRDENDMVPIHPEGRRGPGLTRVVDMDFTSGDPEDFGEGTNRMYIAFHPVAGHVIGVGDTPALATGGDGGTFFRDIYMNFVIDPDSPLAPPSVIGGLVPPGPYAPGSPPSLATAPGENVGSMRLCFRGARAMQGMNTDVRVAFADGNAPGSLQDVSIGPDGIITGRYSNGATRPLGQIPLANFLNPAGLERVGNNLWVTSANSGQFDGVGNIGDLLPGTLEMSNVDLSNEFTEMIVTQRGFQANSRIITTSDEMLMELVNLRR